MKFTVISEFFLAELHSAPTFSDCIQIELGVDFCDKNQYLVQNVTRNQHSAAEFSLGNILFGQIIIEQAGTLSGIFLSSARDAIVANSQNGIPGVSENFSILVENQSTTNVIKCHTIVYIISFYGIPYIFVNFFRIERNFVIQSVTYRPSAELSEKDRAGHLHFVKSLILRNG